MSLNKDYRAVTFHETLLCFGVVVVVVVNFFLLSSVNIFLTLSWTSKSFIITKVNHLIELKKKK